MPSNTAALRANAGTSALSRPVSSKILQLASKASYAAPKVVSFPVNGLKPSEALTMAGNGGGLP